MSDLIDRQAAIEAIGEKSDEIYKTKQKGATYPHDDFFQGMAYAEDVVKQLPPAQPEPPEECERCMMEHTDEMEKLEAELAIAKSKHPEPCEDAVSRHRLLSDLKELIVAWEKYPVMAEQIKGVEVAIGYVELTPSARPEIIRCRECKFASGDSRICMKFDHSPIGELDFCSFAERREVNNESN